MSEHLPTAEFYREDSEELPEPVGFRGIGWGIAFQLIGAVLFAAGVLVGLALMGKL